MQSIMKTLPLKSVNN